MQCPICGKKLENNAGFCDRCKTGELDRIFLSQEAKQHWIDQNRKRYENSSRKSRQAQMNQSRKRRESEIIAHGSCGDNANWSLKKDGCLTISGSGTIDDMEKGQYTGFDDLDDYYFYDTNIRDWFPQYRDGVCINLSSQDEYIRNTYTRTEHVDTVPWSGYRDKITSVGISGGITGIGANAFLDCCNISSVRMPDTIKTIGHAAFKNCDRLIMKKLPSNLTSIGNDAFLHSDGYSGCIVSRIPSTLNYIGDNAFYAREGNKDLRTVALSQKLTYIGGNAFRGCSNMSLSSKYLPNALSDIGVNAFGGCWNLRQVVLPDGLTHISSYAFADCHNLTEVKLPNSLQYIGDSAFSGCKNIQEIEIPASIEDISNHAFENCTRLQKIVFRGEFPKKNTTSFRREGNITVGQHKDYQPFAGTGYVQVYCKASDERFWDGITSYNWGAEKMYWHRVY